MLLNYWNDVRNVCKKWPTKRKRKTHGVNRLTEKKGQRKILKARMLLYKQCLLWNYYGIFCLKAKVSGQISALRTFRAWRTFKFPSPQKMSQHSICGHACVYCIYVFFLCVFDKKTKFSLMWIVSWLITTAI